MYSVYCNCTNVSSYNIHDIPDNQSNTLGMYGVSELVVCLFLPMKSDIKEAKIIGKNKL